MAVVTEIQDQYCSNYDRAKLCTFDVEFIDKPTKPLIHQASRFLCFFKGTGVIKINGVSFEIRPHTMVVILPWETSEISAVYEPLQLYKIIYNADHIFRAMRFECNFENEQVNFLTTMEKNPVIYLQDEETQEFNRIMLGLKDEAGIDSVYEAHLDKALSNVLITGKLTELIVRFFRIASCHEAVQGNTAGGPSDRDNCRLIFKYMYSHLSERLTLEKVAAVVYMSASSVSKAVSEATGLTFSELLSEMRIAKAINILIHTDMTLSEIAKLCGFTDASHFSKVFASHIGTTANEYRKINKKVENIFRDSEKDIGFEIISYILQNYNDPSLNIQTAMDRFDLTAQEINKILLIHVEKNFDSFLHSIRINRACEYLLTTDMSILDIAIEVGYSNIRTFNRNFAKLKNMTPGSFRKSVTLQAADESIAQ